jgi:hypothetical protein
MSTVARFVPSTSLALPVYSLLKIIVEFSPTTRLRWSTEFPYLLATLIEAIVAWFIATRIFAVRDVAIPVE